MSKLYCGKCGSSITKGNDFCENCGAKAISVEQNNTQVAESNTGVKEKKSPQKRKYVLIASVVFLVFLCLGFFKVKEIVDYNKAVELYNMHYYVEARERFKKTSNFKDSNKYLNSVPYKMEGTWADKSILGNPPQKIIFKLEPEGKVKWGMLANYTKTDSWNATEDFRFGYYKIMSVDDNDGGQLIMNDYAFGDRVIVVEFNFVSKSTEYSE